MEYRYQKKNGELLWVRVLGYCVRKDAEGRATRLLGCHIDLSERKNAEKKIEQKNRELEEMNEALIASNEQAKVAIKTKDEFLSIISHELRTPLNPIVGFSELLIEEAGGNDEVLEKAKAIHQSSVSMLRLIDDMLDYLRIQKHDFVELSLPELIDDCVGKIQLSTPSKEELSIHYDSGDLISLRDSVTVMIDQKMLQLVIVNLLENALTYSDYKPVTIRSGLVTDKSNTLRIEIIDQGIGIAPDKQKEIFDAFYQVDSSYSRPYEGLGLGLAICKKVIELLEGKIGVSSELKKGSNFWFEVPVVCQERPAASS
jgi:signal transduction histidine kinase